MHDLHVDADASTQERVLQLVIERGPISAAELAELLDLAPAGVRRHIAALEREERIVVHEPAGPELRRRGRPARFYVATDAGRSGMSHSYPEIATAALDYLHAIGGDRKSTRLNSSHVAISYAVFCLKKKKRYISTRCTDNV